MFKKFADLFNRRKGIKAQFVKTIHSIKIILPFLDETRTKAHVWDVEDEAQVPQGMAVVGLFLKPGPVLLGSVHRIVAECCRALHNEKGLLDLYDRVALRIVSSEKMLLHFEVGKGRLMDVATMGRSDFSAMRDQLGAPNYLIKPVWYELSRFADEEPDEFKRRMWRMTAKKKVETEDE